MKDKFKFELQLPPPPSEYDGDELVAAIAARDLAANNLADVWYARILKGFERALHIPGVTSVSIGCEIYNDYRHEDDSEEYIFKVNDDIVDEVYIEGMDSMPGVEEALDKFAAWTEDCIDYGYLPYEQLVRILGLDKEATVYGFVFGQYKLNGEGKLVLAEARFEKEN